MSVTKRVTFEVPGRNRIPEVQAEVTRVLDEHAIVENVGGRGQVLWFRVTFAAEHEVKPLTTKAHNAALHVTTCDMTVRAAR